MRPLATVIVPTHDHGPTLRHAVTSALAQSVAEIEVVIVGDGVPDAAREIALDLVRGDDRVSFRDNPKGPRHGEIHRREVVDASTAAHIFYLSDDDLWFPDHVERLLDLLDRADFAHALPVWIDGDGRVIRWVVDLALPYFRALHVDHGDRGRIPLSCAAHSTAAYRRLPYGWRTTPGGTYTDLYMWQQFLDDPACRVVSGTTPTVLGFPDSLRRDMTAEERARELEEWAEVTRDPARRVEHLHAVVAAFAEPSAWFESQIASLEAWQKELLAGLDWQRERADALAKERDALLAATDEQAGRASTPGPPLEHR